jgi:hypothetical protein
MKKIYRWQPTEGIGLEYAEVAERSEGIAVNSSVIGEQNGESFALTYRLLCTAGWHVRELHIGLVSMTNPISLIRDHNGWRDAVGRRLSDLDGCQDVDISATPLTNTLPIRRLKLEVGQSQEISVAYIQCPSLELGVNRQRYTRQAETQYHFELVDGSFSATITVDADGFVTEYPSLFKAI